MAVLGTQVIKSIQRGNTALTVGNTGIGPSADVTINSVDLDKSFVSTGGCANGYMLGNLSSTQTNLWSSNATMIGARLAGATQLTVQCGGGVSYNARQTSAAQIFWEVIEYV
tara:strand:+ start:2990 stop:3325 length:336 start_codon:yes stop_codon:yes gene_type:complete